MTTKPNILLCDLALRRTTEDATQYELPVPKEYSALILYVWKSSHHSQAVVNVLIQGSMTTTQLAYQTAGWFQVTGETVTIRLVEHVSRK